MIKLFKHGRRLLLIYQPDRFNDSRWVDDRIRQNGDVTLRRTFTFTSSDLVSVPNISGENDSDQRTFLLGTQESEYYKVGKEILDIKHDLLLAKTMALKPQTFIAQRDISVFRKIDELIDEPIVVGGNSEHAIPLEDFELLLKTFPSGTELTHYARMRIARVLKDYLGTMSDAESKLNRHLRQKNKLPTHSHQTIVSNFELQKFEYVHAELESMLKEADGYSEKDWQTKILDLLLFVFPKYIAVLENIHIKDFYSAPGTATKRYIDLMLVDASGSVDIIEVKKPFSSALLSRHTYRDNHTPKLELAGAVMQAEKYLFHLSKWGQAGEQEIHNKYKSKLPAGIALRITNPKAMILLGRDNDLVGQQRFDFEIIRRQYANMLDIMTYDDLLRRVGNIVEMMKRNFSSEEATKEGDL